MSKDLSGADCTQIENIGTRPDKMQVFVHGSPRVQLLERFYRNDSAWVQF
jgi:hypothetical protein